MVRCFIYDKHFLNGQMPCEIVEYPAFCGRYFNDMKKCFYALYEDLDIFMVFDLDGVPFVSIHTTYKNGKFTRTITDERKVSL